MASTTSTAMGSSYDQPSRYSLDLGHRRLGEAAPNGRHNSPPGRKRVKEEKEASRFSYYMTSDCRPRSSGFFGSTGGDPVLFEYGFELETTIFATMDKILNIISDKVMDEMISRTFSDMCGVHRRRVQDTASEPTSASSSVGAGKVTGFHFSAEEKVQSSTINSLSIHEKKCAVYGFLTAYVSASCLPLETCLPQLHEKNSCSYYASQVKVFGYNLDEALVRQLMGYARDALPSGLADAAQSGAVRVVLADDLTKPISSPGSSSASGSGGLDSTSAGATAGLVLACSVLLISIGVLVAYYFAEIRQRAGKAQGKKGRSRTPFAQYFDTRSLTNTYQVTESDDSEARAARLSASRVFDPKDKNGTGRDREQTDPLAHEPHDLRPIIVEFGPSFDPERDRYLQAMEEMSSVPPSYAKHLAMSAELSFRDLQIV